ncbi:hypothetical protein [Mongoliitalea daihaiensis]|uniref:hypothetical protein n=1 Tax=Mongoliitalea daihaiensis TaxID=2782006 RepID=UPI001F43B868|nr:hypothetical protein [Mongoliitalea daihaiensis]UJP64214.1 hypothetical protein IPZ59_15575 [Mongoliitalea daihaiensis]
MKQITFSNLVVLIAMFLVACSSEKKEEDNEEIYVEANVYHQSSLDAREEIMEIEKVLKELGIEYADLKEELKIWDKEIIEVPGFEHSHDDEFQRKYHVHNRMKPFSAEEHLEYQKAMNAEIKTLFDSFRLLTVEKVMDDQKNEEDEGDL